MAVIPRFGRVLFVLLRFFSFFFRRAYRRFSAEQRFLKNSPQSSLIWLNDPLSLISEQSCFADFPVSFRTVLAQYISQAFLYLQFEIFCGVFRNPLNIRHYSLFRNNLESGVFPCCSVPAVWFLQVLFLRTKNLFVKTKIIFFIIL